MRSLSEIKEDIRKHEKAIFKLQKEFDEFQEKCPHPDPFIFVTHKDTYDEAVAPVYEQTYSTAKCLLCELTATVGYDASLPKGYRYNRVYKTAREVLNG